MSTTLTPTEADRKAREVAVAEDAAADKRTKRAKRIHYFGMPAFLVAAMGALLLYIQVSELDSIEARTLTFSQQFQRLQEHLLEMQIGLEVLREPL
jgi:hypothetical protein